MTRPPRILVGAFSAEKTGTVTSFKPMPMPRSILHFGISPKKHEDSCVAHSYLHAASCPQVCETAMPNGASREKTAATKMTPRRPRTSFRGSEIHPALLTVRQDFRNSLGNLQEADGNIRHRIDQTNDPAIPRTVALVGNGAAVRGLVRDAQSSTKGQVRAIRSSLHTFTVKIPCIYTKVFICVHT